MQAQYSSQSRKRVTPERRSSTGTLLQSGSGRASDEGGGAGKSCWSSTASVISSGRGQAIPADEAR